MAHHEEELGTYVSKEQILPTATSRRWASYERSRSSLCQASDAIHPKRSCVVRLGHEHVRCVNAPVPVTHYRDAKNREIDAVVELPGGVWGAFEIKLGANQIDEAAEHLLAMKSLMERDATARPPVVLAVICGMSSAAYTRPDGVMVVPPTALRP